MKKFERNYKLSPKKNLDFKYFFVLIIRKLLKKV